MTDPETIQRIPEAQRRWPRTPEQAALSRQIIEAADNEPGEDDPIPAPIPLGAWAVIALVIAGGFVGLWAALA